MTDLKSVLKGGLKKELTEQHVTAKKTESFTPEQLQNVWKAFAEKRKPYQATYQLLTQEFDLIDNKVIVHLHNQFQETLLNEIRLDLLTFLREGLSNDSIQLAGEVKAVADDKKVLYTNREKFDHLAKKNPLVKDLQDKFGLDTDF